MLTAFDKERGAWECCGYVHIADLKTCPICGHPRNREETMIEIPTRRGLITGLGALFLAAPAIVKASSLMPINSKLLVPEPIAWNVAFTWRRVDDHLEIVQDGKIVSRILQAAEGA
jgi:hypothetical protein